MPLPVSILTCLAVFAFLAGWRQKIYPALALMAGTLVVCLISLWFGGDDLTPPHRKLIMIGQVLLPLAGLLLGLAIDGKDKDKVIARAFLVVLSIVVPFQLLATWAQGGFILTHYLYGFSIYSHFQYVPLIFVCAFAFSLTSLWDEEKVWLCLLTVPMSIYAVASVSFLTIFAYLAMGITFAVSRLWVFRKNKKVMTGALALVAVMAVGGGLYLKKLEEQRPIYEGFQGLFQGKFRTLSEGKIPSNVSERFGDWRLFGEKIAESRKTLWVGHPEPMPREVKSSPHNWYIDIAHTFGIIGLLPIVGMIGYTIYLCWRQRRTLTASTWWLAAIVFYLVIVDSNFKVTLRQPYPGIFAYFLWGLLLARLRFPMPPQRGG